MPRRLRVLHMPHEGFLRAAQVILLEEPCVAQPLPAQCMPVGVQLSHCGCCCAMRAVTSAWQSQQAWGIPPRDSSSQFQ